MKIKNAFNNQVLSKSLNKMSSKHFVTACHAVDGGSYTINNIPLITDINILTQYSPLIFMLQVIIGYCIIVSHMMLHIHAEVCKFYKKEENLFFYYLRRNQDFIKYL